MRLKVPGWAGNRCGVSTLRVQNTEKNKDRISIFAVRASACGRIQRVRDSRVLTRSTRIRVTGSPARWALAGTLSTPASSSRDTRTPQTWLRDFVYSINRSDSKVSGRYRETNVTRESNEQP